MTITTKKGDTGQTDIKNKRLSKSDPLINLIGELDVLSSEIIYFQSKHQLDKQEWEMIVQDLYQISSVLSGYLVDIDLNEHIHYFEDEIAKKQNLTHQFIFPFDDELKAHLHVLRAKVRTVERTIIAYSLSQSINLDILKYMNRLSDYIFSKEL